MVFVSRMTIGTVELQDVWAVAMELQCGEDLDGIIGVDVFRDFLLTYDCPAARSPLSTPQESRRPAPPIRLGVPLEAPGR